MPLKGQAKKDYQRGYMRHRRWLKKFCMAISTSMRTVDNIEDLLNEHEETKQSDLRVVKEEKGK